MTLAQARQLLTSALRYKHLSLEEAIKIVHYHQRRNYVAYQSHRKRTLKKYRERHLVTRKYEISL